MPAAEQTAWTTRRLLDWMSGAFKDKGVDSPRLCAEMLIAHVLECERLRLYMETDRPASPDELGKLRNLTARALKHEPVQYLVGEAWFFGSPFHVDRRALIPRPSTETIVEHVLQHARRTAPTDTPHQTDTDATASAPPPPPSPLRIADVCTGSGCMAIALAIQLEHATILATDISPDALALAAANADRHNVAPRIELGEGDLLEPVLAAASEHGAFDYLVTNPPYISDAEWDVVPPNVKDHEPVLALRAGSDGLDMIRPLIERAHECVRPGGLVLIETAASHAEQAAEIARTNAHLTGVHVLKDFEGLPRVVCATRA